MLEDNRFPKARTISRPQEIERSIIKKFRRTIWNRMIGGIKDYKLISPGDRIAVCISGGKDSMLLGAAFQHLQKYSEIPFEAVYLTMDPGYAPANRALIEENAKALGLDIHFCIENRRVPLLPLRQDEAWLPLLQRAENGMQ